ncbi:hypothetical protein F7725_009456 [Dissostichus mawsoni]|uniref:Uncharacterized protein n=1 Tax=Dissostichus mawsoni TaxID=36200 RepID=A0A7J5XNN1_DISMA|nr:hypothetical protein F7725_009456 [Dissostichus mawsoni]
MEALADTVLEKQRGYLDLRFVQLQQMGRETEEKLTSIQTDLVVLSESIGTLRQRWARYADPLCMSDVNGQWPV